MNQNKVIIDFETRSTVNLKKVGIWAYAEHPTTDILCMAFKYRSIVMGGLAANIVRFEGLSDRGKRIAITWLDADNNYIFEAYNAEFERAIWHCICHKRWGWLDIPLTQWRCIAAKAAALSLPRSLEGVAKALNLSQQKDKAGWALMMKMCKPRKPLKAEKVEWLEKQGFFTSEIKKGDWVTKKELEYAEKYMPTLWHEKPEDFEKLYAYCKQDVETEAAVSERLRELSTFEQNLWYIDQKINQRGVQIDVESINKAIIIRDTYEKQLLQEFKNITGLESPRQVAETVKYLERRGIKLKDLTKLSVKNALKKESNIPKFITCPKTKRALELRQTLSLSSVAKLDAMLKGVSENGRAKSILLYYGGHTGRWSGKRIQPQNMPRSTIADVEYFIELMNRGAADALSLLWGADLYKSLSACIRSFIVAKPGYDFVCADFSSIEAIVNAWLAGEQHVLDAFKAGLDLYKVAAADIFNKHYDSINKKERSAGKIADLALGYQGALKAYSKMAVNYDVHMPGEQIQVIVHAWRESHPMIKSFWYAMENAAMRATKSEYTQTWGKIIWGKKDNWLFCRLPSGRCLGYYEPKVKVKMMPWGKNKEVLTYMGVNSITRKWGEQVTYGGKLVENIVQAVARDILAEAIVRAEAHQYPVVLHVHDEIVAEVPEGFGSLKAFEELVAVNPIWAEDCPITAAGWRGKRYRKE